MAPQKTAVRNTLCPAEAARKLRLGLDYVYVLIWSGKLEARKRNGRWEVPAKAVEQRLKAREERHG